MPRLTPALLVTLSLTVHLAAQNTIVVQGGGAALQQAVDAAHPGDTLDVRAARYSGVVIGKGITVQCAAGVVVENTVGAALMIDGVPQGETLQVRGGRYVGGGFLVAPPLKVRGCVGTVVLDRVLPVPSSSLFGILALEANPGPVVLRGIDVGLDEYFLPASSIESCDQVSFSHCTELPPVGIRNSRVCFDSCDIAPRNASTGMVIDGGDVSISGGVIEGSYQFSAGFPLPALDLRAGRLTIAGDTGLRAGSFVSVWAPAVDVRGGELRIASTVTLGSNHPTPIRNSGGLVRHLDIPALHAPGMPPGSIWDVEVFAAPQSLTGIFVDLLRTPTPLPFGDFWITLGVPPFDFRTTPASGTFTLHWTLPTTVPLGLPVSLQPVSVTASGELWVGSAARTTLR